MTGFGGLFSAVDGVNCFAFGNFPMARVGVEHGICLIIFVMSKMVFCVIGEIGMSIGVFGYEGALSIFGVVGMHGCSIYLE